MTAPETMTLTEFARHMGVRQSYASELKRIGRLVLTDDGRRVRVAESMARIEATRDPSKQGVADRHAEARGHAVTGHVSHGHAIDAVLDVAAIGDAADGMLPSPLGYDYQGAKAKREHWAAEREHAAFRRDAGELMERSDVVAAFADAGATLRGKLESWASMLPPQLTGRDESAIRATIADQVEQLLTDLSQQFGRISGEQT